MVKISVYFACSLKIRK